MLKSDAEVIKAFNEQVNMSIEELEAWLDSPESEKAGTGVGHDSGRRIVEILKKNPGKDPKQYDEEDLQHMHKVVAYNSRHLAQEDHLKETKTLDELEKTKSTISLRNWGHDPVKVKKQEEGTSDDKDDKTADKQTEQTLEEGGDEDGEGETDTEGERDQTEAKQNEDAKAKGGDEGTNGEEANGQVDLEAKSGENEEVDTGEKRKRGTADAGAKETKKRQTAPSRRARGSKIPTATTTRKTRSSSKVDGDTEE